LEYRYDPVVFISVVERFSAQTSDQCPRSLFGSRGRERDNSPM
jgi:hypothetical protein